MLCRPAVTTKIIWLRMLLYSPKWPRCMWPEMMISHHEGAIEMTQTEIATGANDQAKQLAHCVVSAQPAEVDQMKGMLAQR